jgi:glycosyltransferase involved in cell wall biosynthesis
MGKPNILFLGPYRHQLGDGWGDSSHDYIRALDKTNNNLTIRPIYMNGSSSLPPDDFYEWEYNKCKKFDVTIFNVLPDLLIYNRNVGKNVALIYTETGGLNYSGWIEKLSLMDEVWVPSLADENNLKESGLKTPIKVIGMPINIEKFTQSYEPLFKTNKCVFYFIGEMIHRKGLDVLFRAFLTEFKKDEPVTLVVKTSKGGLTSKECADKCNELIAQIKGKLRLYKDFKQYKDIQVITEKISENDICRLHSTGHCLVMPSRGESWSRPTADAVGFGKEVIVTDRTGPASYVKHYKIQSSQQQVFTDDTPLPEIYSGREKWWEPSQEHLQHLMRLVFKSFQDKTMTDNSQLVEQFSYENMAKRLEKLL